MRILFTGASSFTGYWFVRELVGRGHQVVCPITRDTSQYEGTRGLRVKGLREIAKVETFCRFGSKEFIQLIRSRQWDLLCHHAADVTDYKSPDFDTIRALENNTHNLRKVLEALQEQDCYKVVLTGSVFEQDEGVGSAPLRAFSPYGLSKGLTYEVFKYHAAVMGLSLGKFVIPNPFGPLEEVRFTTFLAKTWLARQCADVSMPDYVRDNIHVSLLAKAYSQFVSNLPPEAGVCKFNPSGYAGSQGDFTRRFAEAMRPRLNVPCEFNLSKQVNFSEPLERVNTDRLNPGSFDWNEKLAWDELADFYLKTYQPVSS